MPELPRPRPHEPRRDRRAAHAGCGRRWRRWPTPASRSWSAPLPAAHGEPVEALRRLERAAPETSPAAPLIAAEAPDVAALERAGRRDLLAGEVQLDRRAEAALERGRFAALVAWVPSGELPALAERLAAAGGAAVELARPPLVEPPTLLRPGRTSARFAALVDTYGAARYADVDPTPFAAASFVLMFGLMFGDVGHGLLLAALGLALRRARAPRWQGARRLWAFPFACGLAAAAAGLLYGEAFGPTGLVPTLWLAPLDEPVRLLAVAGAIGALLLAISYVLGIVNRWREGGAGAALTAPSGIAGFALFAGLGGLGVGLYLGAGAAGARRPRDRPCRPGPARGGVRRARRAGPRRPSCRWRSSSSTPWRASRRTSSRSPGWARSA